MCVCVPVWAAAWWCPLWRPPWRPPSPPRSPVQAGTPPAGEVPTRAACRRGPRHPPPRASNVPMVTPLTPPQPPQQPSSSTDPDFNYGAPSLPRCCRAGPALDPATTSRWADRRPSPALGWAVAAAAAAPGPAPAPASPPRPYLGTAAPGQQGPTAPPPTSQRQQPSEKKEQDKVLGNPRSIIMIIIITITDFEMKPTCDTTKYFF